jgi:hypothetical protein
MNQEPVHEGNTSRLRCLTVDAESMVRQAMPGGRVIAAGVGRYVFCLLFMAGSLYSLHPNRRITQYSHTAWRIQDASAPASMASIAQTSNVFLWFSSAPGDLYRFEAFVSRRGIYPLRVVQLLELQRFSRSQRNCAFPRARSKRRVEKVSG